MFYEESHSLLRHNTFGIDCACDYFGEYGSADELRALLAKRPNVRTLHIGRGSNLLFLADRFHGLVLHNGMSSMEMLRSTRDDVLVRAGGGLLWDEFVQRCLSAGFHGLENLSCIPGEVGAAAVQNIGAYGVEVSQFVERVNCMELSTRRICSISAGKCDYSYRGSRFKSPADAGRWAVLSVTFRLARRFRPKLEYEGIQRQMELRGVSADKLTPRQLRDIVGALRRSKLPDPAVMGNAGSFFKNPVVTRQQFQRILSEHPEASHHDAGNGMVKLSAAWLIDQCGWRGRSMGPAGVHRDHALVLVNLGGARGSDIHALSEAIRRDVYERFGVALQPEVNFI